MCVAKGFPARATADTEGGWNPVNDYRLTHRERQVLTYASEGWRNAEIARELHLSLYTIKSHMHSILGKLGVRSRHVAGNLARSEGLLLRHVVTKARKRML